MLFAASLIENGFQSSTLKSYMSAIKSVLMDDNYDWQDGRLELQTLSRAYRIVNNKLTVRLPICLNLLEVILFEIKCFYHDQYYLAILYQTLVCIGYHGLFRIRELTSSSHMVKAKDVHIGTNKDKLLFILYSSKTHGEESRPQKIKIKVVTCEFSMPSYRKHQKSKSRQRFFCPFMLSHEYLKLRGQYQHESDQFFVFKDKSPVKPQQVNWLLKKIFKAVNLDMHLYSFHSLQIGRATDMVHAGCSIDSIKLAGRWKSNAVFKYIRTN